MGLWDSKETWGPKDPLEYQDLQDKMDQQDPKVRGVWTASPVRGAQMEVVSRALRDLQENGDRWASSASQEPGAQRVR